MTELTVPAVIAAGVAADPGKPMVIDPASSLTYHGLDTSSTQLAAALVAGGVGKGSRVGLLAPNGNDDCPAGDPPKQRGGARRGRRRHRVRRAPFPGYLSGYGALAPEMVRDILRIATLRPVCHPGEPQCEKSCRPTAAQKRFMRSRDLTCRFPGCDARTRSATSITRRPGRTGPHTRRT